MGCRKLMVKLEAFMLDHQIKMGRDALFNLLAANQLLIRRRNRRVTTTFSSHWLRKYPNLIREFIAEGINQLWVSDITYWRFENKFLYISFVTDVFSHKIVGYHLSESLEAESSIHALEMALDQLKHPVKGLIHHSDRGIQYCCKEYVKLLQDNGVAISMTENGDPLENALAERVNGIIKGEYLDCYEVNSIQEANELLSQVINLYNQERPHMSIGNKTPEEVHQTNQKIDRLWKNYYPKNRTLVNQ